MCTSVCDVRHSMEMEIFMNESYVECMVASKTPGYFVFLRYLLIGLTVVCGLGMFVLGEILFIVAIVFGVGAYFLGMYTDVEYEYLYLDKEISVDKIFHKTKRKHYATYELDKIEIMAPFHSYRLDNYKNRQAKVVDISSRVEEKPDKRYVFFYEGSQKIIFEPNETMIKVMKNISPRKIFSD